MITFEIIIKNTTILYYSFAIRAKLLHIKSNKVIKKLKWLSISG